MKEFMAMKRSCKFTGLLREDSGQNEAERLNARIGDALCDGGSLKWEICETLHGRSEKEVKALSTSELDAQSSKVMGTNAWAVAEEVCLRIDHSPAPQEYISGFLVARLENQFFFNREYLKEYLGVTNNQKSSVLGIGYFSKLEQFESLHCEKGELYIEYRRMSSQERNGDLCKFCEKDETTSAIPVVFLDTQMCIEILVEHYASKAVYFIFMSKPYSCTS